MSGHVAACLSATALVLFLLLGLASKPIQVRVTPRRGFAPHDVFVQVRVPRHADNRWVRVEVDSGLFRRDSGWPVEGEKSQTLWSFFYKDLPTGDYFVTATLYGPADIRAVDRFEFFLLGAP